MSYSEQFTNSLRQAGLNVSRVMITGLLPCPNETVADQVVHQLGPPSTWQQLRQVIAAYIHACGFFATASKALCLAHTLNHNLQKLCGLGDHVGLRIVMDCTMHCVSISVGEICYNVHLAEL